MITREADYAIRVILFLAEQSERKMVSTQEISDKMFIPYRFLRKITHKLTESGFIGSAKGKSGGVYLLKNPEEVSLYDIICAFDPKALVLNSCEQQSEQCPRVEFCSVHERLGAVQEKLDSLMQNTMFSELVGDR